MNTIETLSLIAACNTYAHYVRLSEVNQIFFNSPDMEYFDGSAEGYWRRKAKELGANDDDLNQTYRDICDEAKHARNLR